MALRLAIPIVIALGVPDATHAECALDRRLFGLPVWAASPNEGNTWGAMPIWMAVCPADRHTHWIFAPSVTWNSIVRVTGTLRLFAYPDANTELAVIAAASTRHNRQLLVTWNRLPLVRGAWTHEVVTRLERNVFARFYGLGPDTTAGHESSYTTIRALGAARIGRNLGHHLNLGVTLHASRDRVEPTGIDNLPLATRAFPDAPGMQAPAILISEGLELRYDDRVGGDFAPRGNHVAVAGAIVHGVRGSPSFVRATAQASTIVPEHDRITGAARVYWSGVSSATAPFYAQSMLGGAYLLRGFTAGRFVDRMAWTAEIEQRIRLLRTRFFGVTADWRIDPFVVTGQVFRSWRSIASHPRLAAGAGLRVLVRPRVLGRVDLAYAGEGLKVYVEIGYPF